MKISKIEATATVEGWAKWLIVILNRLRLFELNITINVVDDSKKGIPL